MNPTVSTQRLAWPALAVVVVRGRARAAVRVATSS